MSRKLWGFSFIFISIFLALLLWILIHVLAFFGVFLAFAYPIWWLFFPRQTVCFFCRVQREGSSCLLCKQRIIKRNGVVPQTLRSAILNGIFLLLFSLLSLGIVYGESQILSLFGFPTTSKTASFSTPSQGQYKIHEIFPMEIIIENIDNPINAIQADIGFDPEKVTIVDITTDESFAKVFLQKEINNSAGWARLTGGLPNPGWSGDKGIFGVVYFRAKNAGLVSIDFLSSSMILANDNHGTDVLKSLPSANYVILPEELSPDEIQEQMKFFVDQDTFGISTRDAQLKFYEEQEMLDPQEFSREKSTKDSIFPHYPLQVLAKVDNFIIDFWKNIFRNG